MDLLLNGINFNQPQIRIGAALMLGALLPLAFAPFMLWPLAILLPAAMLWLLQSSPSARRVFAEGWFFGLGYFGFGVYWIYNSLHVFGMAPPFVAGAITGLLVIYLALFPALIFVSTHFARHFLGSKALWLLPLLWFSFEWIKGWFVTGMPWLSLGYSQTESPLSGYASLVGVYGISALCLLMAVALYATVRYRRYYMVTIVFVIPLVGWLLKQIDWTEPLPASLDVAMVQGNIPQEVKWRYDQRQNIFNTYWRETGALWNNDLIIWPETAIPGHSAEIEQSVLQPMRNAAINQGADILAGLVYSKDGQFYNSVIQLGQTRSLYHKRHLVIFGEYYPMRWLLDFMSNVVSIPFSDLTAGPRVQELMYVDGIALGVSICFEDAFSRDILLALPAANILVNLTNDAWFGDSTAPHQHLQIAQMRAIETGRSMLRATNTGVSAFIDHKGRVQEKSRQFSTESILHSVSARSGATPFYYFGKFQGYLAILILCLILILCRLYNNNSNG